MNNFIAFLLAIFLFVFSFVTVGVNVCDNVNRRINKQELNLVGRVVAEYAGYDKDGKIVVEEELYIKDIRNMLSEELIGCIFVYDNNIKGFDDNGSCIAEISTRAMSETNVVSAVNNVLYELVDCDSELESIKIACSEDYIKKRLFNSIEGVSVFSVTCTKRNENYTYNVVGYCIFPHKNI